MISNTNNTFCRNVKAEISQGEEADFMIISLDMSSDTPIYVQLRNQIVKGIGRGELRAGETLPSVRQMARDAGINTMTVNKTYQILEKRSHGSACGAGGGALPGEAGVRAGAFVSGGLS